MINLGRNWFISFLWPIRQICSAAALILHTGLRYQSQASVHKSIPSSKHPGVWTCSSVEKPRLTDDWQQPWKGHYLSAWDTQGHKRDAVSTDFIDLWTDAPDWSLKPVCRLMTASVQIGLYKKLISNLRPRLNVKGSLLNSFLTAYRSLVMLTYSLISNRFLWFSIWTACAILLRMAAFKRVKIFLDYTRPEWGLML